MKTFLSLILTAALALNASAGENFDKLYSKYASTDGITSISLTESLIQIASKFLKEEDLEAREVLKDIKSVKLLTSEGKTHSGLSGDARKLLDTDGYEELLRVSEKDELVRIMVKETGSIIDDVVVLVDSPDEFVFINITGKIDPEKVGKALQSLNIDVEGLDLE